MTEGTPFLSNLRQIVAQHLQPFRRYTMEKRQILAVIVLFALLLSASAGP